jgi:iron complex transport system permease protein
VRSTARPTYLNGLGRGVVRQAEELPMADRAVAERVTAPVRHAGATTWAARWRGSLLLPLAVALAAALVLATALGSVPIPPLHTLAILLNQTGLFHFPRAWPAADEIIITQLRMPRAVGAALVGGALATAGVLFQALLRNPLADPLLLGTSSGAALGATVAFIVPSSVTWLGYGLVPVFGFAGALLAVTLVYWLATSRGHTPVVTLLLAGVAVSALLSAAQTLLAALSPAIARRIVSLYLWLAGGITVYRWQETVPVVILVVVGLVGAFYLAPTLDAFALGESMAAHLGVPVDRRKVLIVAVAALLVAAAVSISGLVGFVGLVAPHVCRLLLGPRHRLLLPAAALAGATFVVIADVLARTLVAPEELPLGVLTALVGGPFFLVLLRRAGADYRW